MTTTTPDSPLDAFAGSISPTRVPFFYQAGLGVVALAMVLLPLVYVGLIVAMGWLVWWHLMNDITIFDHVRGRAVVLALLAYLGPAVVGLIFVLFLIKPLFSRAPKAPPSFKLSEKDEPPLFEFVKKICGLVGAPVPREIRLDTQVNASAGFRRGWFSFFGNDLVLVIGLPLAAGMSMRQVAGVLAHEFGHFAQGAGMRFNYIIRSVNGWFARVVYERDHWDDKLDGWAQAEHWGIKAVFMLAKGGVWVGRKILWCLMNFGHAISCFMSRQMEFDADSYEAKLAGSSEFPRTAERLRLLGAAHGAALQDAYQTYQNRELPDDLPSLVVWREQTLPEAARVGIQKAATEAKTAWNDTHPADADRVKVAAAWQAEGVFHLEAPAAELFTDFAATSQAVTRHFFLHELEVPASKVRFRETASLLRDRQDADSSDSHLDAFFEGRFHVMRVPPVELCATTRRNEAANSISITGKSYEEQLQQFSKLLETLLEQTLGCDLIRAQFNLSQPGEFGLTTSSLSDAEAALVQTQSEIGHLTLLMQGFESATVTRLGALLSLWRQHHAEEAQVSRLDRLLNAQQRLSRLVPDMMQAHRARCSLELLFNNASNHSDGPHLERKMREVAHRIEVAGNHCISALGDAAHPYLEGHPQIVKALHLPEDADNEWGRVFQLANVCTEALIPLLIRIMGDLCGLALATEAEALPASAQ